MGKPGDDNKTSGCFHFLQLFMYVRQFNPPLAKKRTRRCPRRRTIFFRLPYDLNGKCISDLSYVEKAFQINQSSSQLTYWKQLLYIKSCLIRTDRIDETASSILHENIIHISTGFVDCACARGAAHLQKSISRRHSQLGEQT